MADICKMPFIVDQLHFDKKMADQDERDAGSLAKSRENPQKSGLLSIGHGESSNDLAVSMLERTSE